MKYPFDGKRLWLTLSQYSDVSLKDARLARDALGANQANHEAVFEAVTDWRDDDKIKVIIAVGQAGYKFILGDGVPNQFEVDLYQADSLSDRAAQFVEEELYGEIPEPLRNYI